MTSSSSVTPPVRRYSVTDMGAARTAVVEERPRRLGVLTPSSNTVVEPATMRLVAPLAERLSVHFSRVPVTRVADDPGSDQQFSAGPMVAAASLLADARVDGILWAGTSGAWRGLEEDRRLVAAIATATGLPATTATLALLEAFRALGVRRYALLVPYTASITEAITATLATAGYECVGTDADGLTENWAFASVTAEAIARRLRALAGSGPDAIVIHCTNLRGAEVAQGLEDELGVAILDSVVVGLWGALGRLGIEAPAPGFGRLAGRAPATEEGSPNRSSARAVNA
jgi:maleate isomerase